MGDSADLLGRHDALLCDLDGVIYLGSAGIPEALRVLPVAQSRGIATGFVTNNAGRSPQAVAEHLQRLGLDVDAEAVITSGQAAAQQLSRTLEAGSPVLVVGSDALVQAVVEAGLRPADLDEVLANPESSGVAQGYDPDLVWNRLNEATLAVRAGARWVAANTDSTRPTDLGLMPGTGMMVNAVATATGVEPEVAGKPNRPVFDAAVGRAGSERPIFVGDRLDTDIAGARASGVTSLWVLSGSHGARDAVLVPAEQLPDHVGLTIAAMLDEPIEVSIDVSPETGGASGEARTAQGGPVRIECSGSETTVTGLTPGSAVAALQCLVALRRAGVTADLTAVAADIDRALSGTDAEHDSHAKSRGDKSRGDRSLGDRSLGERG